MGTSQFSVNYSVLQYLSQPTTLSSAFRRAMSTLIRCQAGKVLVTRRYLATHAPLKEKDCTSITPPYHALQEKLALVRKLLDNRPLTLAEKILYSHLADPEKTISGKGLKRGETYLLLHPQVRGCFSMPTRLRS